MITKRHLIIAVLATFCLTATIFMVTSTRINPGNKYDPWLDINDDGKIDLKDYFAVALAYGTVGDPMNKTALLYNVNDTFTELLNRIGNLNASLLELLERVESIEERQGQTKTIRFFESTEVNASGWKDAANFTWIPENASHNAILSVTYFFEYRQEPDQQQMSWGISVNGVFPSVPYRDFVSDVWQQSVVCSREFINPWLKTWLPNQPSYNIVFRFEASGLAFVRNICVILTVIDG